MAKFKSIGTSPDFVFYCVGCKCDHGVWTSNRNGNMCIWDFNGDTDKPTVTPSIMVNRDRMNPTQPQCHSIITAGKIQFLSDCTHEFAGQTVDLPDYH